MEATTQVLDRGEITATPSRAAKLIRGVRAKTRRKFTAEDKIRIVSEGFRKEIPVSDLCRREEISSALYHSWFKDLPSRRQWRQQTTRPDELWPCDGTNLFIVGGGIL